MSVPRTLVLDDDERTTVDERSRASRPLSAKRSYRWVVSRRNWPLVVSILLLSLSTGGMSAVVHRERRVVNSLRKAMHAAKCDQPRPVTEIATGLQTRATPPFGGSEATLRLSGTNPIDRVELEKRGASLLAANDYRAALPCYQLLSARAPGERVFIDLITVLQRKLRCQGESQAKCR